MFTSTVPSRAGSRRPGPPQASNIPSRHASVAQSPPRTPRIGTTTIPVGSPVSGAQVSRYATPTSTPRQPLRAAHTRISPRGIDVDMDGRSEFSHLSGDGTGSPPTLYVNRPELSVELSSQLPREVQRVLANADFQTEAWSGGIDPETGYGYVVSPSTCFAWNTALTAALYPTCYIFPMPSSVGPSNSNLSPFASLVSYGTAREPGLIVASGSGDVRFWDSIGTGLSGAEHFYSLTLDLSAGEYITGLYRFENLIFVFLTSLGQLFRVTITTSHGKSQLVATPFARSGNNPLARVTSTLFPFLPGSSSAAPGEKAIAAAFGQQKAKQGTDLWVLTEKRVQRWIMSANSWEQLSFECDIRRAVEEEVWRKAAADSNSSQGLQMEFLDIGLRADGQVLILVSYSLAKERRGQEVRTYAIVRLAVQQDIATARAFDVLVYDMTADARPGTTPKMVLMDDASAVMVQFGGAIVVASLAQGTTFRQTLTLKSNQSRTFGCGLSPSEKPENRSTISIIIAGNGLLSFLVNHEKVKDFHADTPTNQLKSTLEQAIFYGSMPENPFLFSLSPRTDGNLDAAACFLSREILKSQSPLMRPVLDTRKQLEERVELLRSLILFINDNGMTGQLSTTGKKTLSSDAEKIVVAYNVWALVNSYPQSLALLVLAIKSYIRSIGELFGEDPTRSFFRNAVDRFEVIFVELFELVKSYASTAQTSHKSILQDVNRIILSALDSVQRHRHDTNVLYRIPAEEQHVPLWTSTPAQLNIVNELYGATARLLTDRIREHGGGPQDSSDAVAGLVELQDQLRRLASSVFWVFKERVDHLASIPSANRNDRELHDLQERFTSVRKHVVKQLVLHRLATTAFALVEFHRDFQILAQLCNDPKALEGQDVAPDAVIEKYLEQYHDQFAFELYMWYTDNNQLFKLLNQDPKYAGTLSRFLDAHPNPRISWIHNLATGDMGKASKSLATEADREKNVSARKVALSLEKLCELTKLQPGEDEGTNPEILECDKKLELVSIHEVLLNEFQEILGRDAQHRTTIEAGRADQAEVIAAGTNLGDRPAFQTLFKRLVRQVLKGAALDFEDLIDVLTMKSSEPNQTNGFYEACLVLVRSQGLQAGRIQNALATIWRRALIYDDWERLRVTSGLADSEVAENLRQTVVFDLMQSLTSREDCAELWLPAAEAAVVPPVEEISARFPQYSGAQVNDLRRDYEREQRLLVQHLESSNLEEIYEEIKSLAVAAGAM